MEIGTPGIKSTPDGWLNRYLAEKKNTELPFRGIALTAQLPRMLAGSAPALTLSSIDEFRLRNEAMAATLQKLYSNTSDALVRFGGQNLFAAMAQLRQVESKIPPATERYPTGRFGASLAQIARLIKADVGLEIAFTEIQGWDTHVNQGGAKGQMANRLAEIWPKVWRLSTATSTIGRRMSCSSPCRSSATRCVRTATAARITAMRMSCLLSAARCAAARSMGAGQVSRPKCSMKAGTLI